MQHKVNRSPLHFFLALRSAPHLSHALASAFAMHDRNAEREHAVLPDLNIRQSSGAAVWPRDLSFEFGVDEALSVSPLA